MKRSVRDLLFKSFDASLTEKEQQHLDSELSGSASLNEEKRQIERMRQTLAGMKHPSFKPFFADRVMNNLLKPGDESDIFFESLKLAFGRMAIAAAIIITGLLSYDAIRYHHPVLSNILPSGQNNLEQALDPALTYLQE
ncbi:hypothetical protein JW948_13195 [bacterium]|nr:hypothetical protein [bacterium]